MRIAVAFVVACSAALGCTRGNSSSSVRPEPPAASVALSATASAAAPPVASSVASAPAAMAPDVPLPLPAPPPGVDPERAMFAASICAASYLDKDVGCRSHPPFVRPEQRPDGKIVQHKGDPLLFCGIDRIIRGSFTRAGAKQAVVSFTQCKESEDAMWDAGFPGSAVLVEEISGRWKTVGDTSDVNTNFCQKNRRADGRDVLLCRSNLSAPPAGNVIYFFLVDFARGLAGKDSAGSIALLFADEPSCMLADQGASNGFISLTVLGTTLTDVNKDGTPDLLVTVKRARVGPSPSLDAKLSTLCKKTPDTLPASAFLPPATVTTLELVSSGALFKPSPATKKTLDAWTAQAPENFNGLTGAAPPMLTE